MATIWNAARKCITIHGFGYQDLLINHHNPDGEEEGPSYTLVQWPGQYKGTCRNTAPEDGWIEIGDQ
jgi:hypothetical protein